MPNYFSLLRQLTLASAVCVAGLGGCDTSPPPPRVPVPAQGTPGPERYDYAKPLPGQGPAPTYAPLPSPPPSAPPPQPPPPAPLPPAPTPPSSYAPPPQPAPQAVPGYDPRIAAPPAAALPPPPPPAPPGTYDDPPIVRDRLPEQRAFVDAYNRVGRPKIAVFVNRRLDGEIVPAAGGEKVDRGLPEDAFLRTGQYDDAAARSLDYEAVENILTDWLAAGGQTEIISPTLTRARLTKDQTDALERGEKFVLTDLTQRLDADIFIQVQARPTRQTTRGLEFRLVAEALNTRGGRSIARAVVDIPPPLDKPGINDYTRFLARKLIDDMINTWTAPQPVTSAPPSAPPSAFPPTTQPR